MTILIVDDNTVFLRLFRLYAEDFPELNFKYFLSAVEILDFLKNSDNENIELIVSDIRMPIMSGIELSRIVKRNYPHIPVMLITGLEINYLTNEDLQAVISVLGKNIGIDGIITQIIEYLKPYKWIYDGENLINYVKYDIYNISLIEKNWIKVI